jgi:hypothetical protein
MSNVIRFPGTDETPDELLQRHVGQLAGAVIVGHTHEGHFIVDAAGLDTLAEMIGLIALGQHAVMSSAGEE